MSLNPKFRVNPPPWILSWRTSVFWFLQVLAMLTSSGVKRFALEALTFDKQNRLFYQAKIDLCH